jgi:hypothetical protein
VAEHEHDAWDRMPGEQSGESMSPRLTNALLTGGPLTKSELVLLRGHFLALAGAMVASGPLFAAAHHTAMQLHNQAEARINASPAQNQALLRAQDRAREQEEVQRFQVEP